MKASIRLRIMPIPCLLHAGKQQVSHFDIIELIANRSDPIEAKRIREKHTKISGAPLYTEQR